MGITVDRDDFERITGKLRSLLGHLEAPLQAAGEVAAAGIVETTLAGIGDGDQAFVPYSKSYAALLESMGVTKPHVDLRGAFDRRPGSGRRNAKGSGPSVELRTPFGAIDPRSELSLDRIRVEVEGGKVRIVYQEKTSPHLFFQQTGTSRLPQRKWFSVNKTAVKAGVVKVLETTVHERAEWFNDPGSSAPPPADASQAKAAGLVAMRQAIGSR